MKLKELQEWGKRVGQHVRVTYRHLNDYYWHEGKIEGIDKGTHLMLRLRPERKFRSGAYDSGREYLRYNRIKKIEILGAGS